MGKRTFQNCRFYRSGDVLFADMEVFKGQGNDTEVLSIDRNDTYPIEGLKCTDGKQEDFMEQWIERRLNIKMR